MACTCGQHAKIMLLLRKARGRLAPRCSSSRWAHAATASVSLTVQTSVGCCRDSSRVVGEHCNAPSEVATDVMASRRVGIPAATAAAKQLAPVDMEHGLASKEPKATPHHVATRTMCLRGDDAHIVPSMALQPEENTVEQPAAAHTRNDGTYDGRCESHTCGWPVYLVRTKGRMHKSLSSEAQCCRTPGRSPDSATSSMIDECPCLQSIAREHA